MTTSTITVYRGEQVTLDFTMNPVVDITAWTLAFNVSRRYNNATKLLTKVPTILNGPLGTFRQVLTEEDLDLNPASYVFDVWRTDEGFEQVLALGPFVVTANVRVPPV